MRSTTVGFQGEAMKTLLLKLFQRRLDKTLKSTVGSNSTVTGNGKEDLIVPLSILIYTMTLY